MSAMPSKGEDTPPRLDRIEIKGGTIISGDETRVADVLVVGGKIRAVGQFTSSEDAFTIDASECLVLPGFVDGHRHLWQANLRGLLADNVLAEYYKRVRIGFATAFTPDDVYASVYAGALDALADGITTVLDHAHIINSPEHADAAVAALKDSGLRTIFCYGFFSAPTKERVFPDRASRYRDIARVRQTFLPSDDGLVTMGAALTEHWICSPDVTTDEVRVSRELGLKHITLHVGSTPGTTDINRFECTQCCGSEFTYSHCNSCQEEFFRLVRERGGGIVATPETEMGMGMGAPAIRQTIDAGVPLGLGVDIVSYGAGDPFTLARLALTSGRSEECRAAVQRGEMPTKVGLTTKDALKWLTHGGATAIGLQDKIGSLEIGKSADVVLLRTDSLHMAPMHDPVTSVVMHARSSDIDTVLVEGQLRVSKGRLVGVDVSSVVKRVRASQAAIFERLEKGRDEESETVKAYDALLAAKQR